MELQYEAIETMTLPAGDLCTVTSAPRNPGNSCKMQDGVPQQPIPPVSLRVVLISRSTMKLSNSPIGALMLFSLFSVMPGQQVT
jgi:hypothetical protein